MHEETRDQCILACEVINSNAPSPSPIDLQSLTLFLEVNRNEQKPEIKAERKERVDLIVYDSELEHSLPDACGQGRDSLP